MSEPGVGTLMADGEAMRLAMVQISSAHFILHVQRSPEPRRFGTAPIGWRGRGFRRRGRSPRRSPTEVTADEPDQIPRGAENAGPDYEEPVEYEERTAADHEVTGRASCGADASA